MQKRRFGYFHGTADAVSISRRRDLAGRLARARQLQLSPFNAKFVFACLFFELMFIGFPLPFIKKTRQSLGLHDTCHRQWQAVLCLLQNKNRQTSFGALVTAIGRHECQHSPSARADIDHDVDLNDASPLVSNFGATSGSKWSEGDFDGDGDVDLNDASPLVGNFGNADPDTAGASGDGSGDIFIAFSTANDGILSEDETSKGLSMHPNNDLSKLFLGTIEATEEAIVNALVAAETMVGADGLRLPELPEDKLRQIMQEHAAEKGP